MSIVDPKRVAAEPPPASAVRRGQPDRSEPEEAAQKLEPFRTARPVASKAVNPDAPTGPPEDDAADDQIINRADDGEEVRHEIDRRDEVEQQRSEGPLDAPRGRVVAEQGTDQPHKVRDEANSGTSKFPRWSVEPKDGYEEQPGYPRGHDDDEQAPRSVHGGHRSEAWCQSVDAASGG